MELGEVYQNIPTWDNGVWTKTSFSSREEFSLWLESDVFKEPGEYEFDEVVLEWRKEAAHFEKHKYYCHHSSKSKDYKIYWEDQKYKSRKGVLYIKGDKCFYLTRAYYFWINFLPINDKKKKTMAFPLIRDAQYHMALYEFIAELKYLHAAVVKKRQFGSSFYHTADLINLFWFEEQQIMKIGAHLDTYVTGAQGSWKMLNDYRDHLNKHTAWYRPMDPKGVGEWQQKIEVSENGRSTTVGNKSILKFNSLFKEPTNGVGGLTTKFFYEEGGVAPKADLTYEFIRPALEDGEIVTGQFIIAGSVGDLEQCEPLKKFIYRPEANGFYAVKNKYANNKGTVVETGLFIPEQWSMPPYIDDYGNSKVKEALNAIKKQREEDEKKLDPIAFQIRCSQKPTTLEEAFASKEGSIFPTALISSHKLKIQDKEYPYETFELERSSDGRVQFKPSKKLPIFDFPISKTTENKEGVVCVWEKPDIKDGEIQPEWGIYYASVDPVKKGKTNSSESLCSIYIYKRSIEVTKIQHDERMSYIEGDKIVASWCGRFDDLNKTHALLENLIEAYNAWTLVECNVSQFIIHMIERKKQRYLVKRKDMLFLREISSTSNVHDEYGWHNSGKMFRDHLVDYLIQFLQEELHVETDENGNTKKIIYGITRIPDIMAMEEMEKYEPGMNVDRLIALAALISFMKVQFANVGYKKVTVIEDNKYLEKSKKMYTFNSKPFKNIGVAKSSYSSSKNRNPFKRLR